MFTLVCGVLGLDGLVWSYPIAWASYGILPKLLSLVVVALLRKATMTLSCAGPARMLGCLRSKPRGTRRPILPTQELDWGLGFRGLCRMLSSAVARCPAVAQPPYPIGVCGPEGAWYWFPSLTNASESLFGTTVEALFLGAISRAAG